MSSEFEGDQYDLINEDRIRVPNHRFGHDRYADLDVWIESDSKGERFLSQLRIEGETFQVRKEAYTRKCYILRHKATGDFRFLDLNDCGFWLQTCSFSGAQTFFGDESVEVHEWLKNCLASRVPLTEGSST